MFTGGISIGKIFGIQITVDYSWIFIFLLVTWNLTFGVFPLWHPNWGLPLSLFVAIIASLLFFASVLAHELAHSVVAKSRGLSVSQITLFILGGVSNLTSEPTSPGTEFVMAVVGPLTSIIIGALSLLIVDLSANHFIVFFSNPIFFLSQLTPLQTLLLWLGPVNILVGLFNLIPGFPLDGGRIFRSIVWAITHNFEKSTRIASFLGQLIGWLFILSGVLMIFGVSIPLFGSGLQGLWLIFIGLFLNAAAGQSYQQVMVEDQLKNVEVENVMRSQFQTIQEDAPVKDLINNYFLKSSDRSFPVMKDGELSGLVSLEDVKDVDQTNWEKEEVKDVMTSITELETVSPKEDLTHALGKISEKDLAQVPVIKDHHLVGMLDRRDILLWLQIHANDSNGDNNQIPKNR